MDRRPPGATAGQPDPDGQASASRRSDARAERGPGWPTLLGFRRRSATACTASRAGCWALLIRNGSTVKAVIRCACCGPGAPGLSWRCPQLARTELGRSPSWRSTGTSCAISVATLCIPARSLRAHEPPQRSRQTAGPRTAQRKGEADAVGSVTPASSPGPLTPPARSADLDSPKPVLRHLPADSSGENPRRLRRAGEPGACR
jgi:hypothetical protein